MYSQSLGGQYQPLICPLSSNNILSFPSYEQLVSKQVFLFFQGKDSRPNVNGSLGCCLSSARLICILLISLILPCYLNAFIYCRTLQYPGSLICLVCRMLIQETVQVALLGFKIQSNSNCTLDSVKHKYLYLSKKMKDAWGLRQEDDT